LLAGSEAEAWKVAEDQREPGAPDEEFQHHHDEESEANRGVHSSGVASVRDVYPMRQAKTTGSDRRRCSDRSALIPERFWKIREPR